ncbi:hypothetical protein N9K06_01630, partial [Omnitrophica bacterium]|nr:hypothetical protein [Candidatus Omnitrophota bacterium]
DFIWMAFKHRVVIYLEPAADTPQDRLLEEGKLAYSKQIGHAVQKENYLGPRPNLMPNEAVDAVWFGRLSRRFFDYILVTLNELRLKHHLISRNLVPFMPDTWHYLHVQIRPPREGDYKYDVYRATGLDLYNTRNIRQLVTELVLFWGSLLAGMGILFKKYPVGIVAMTLSLSFYMIMCAALVFVDTRYLLPYVIPIYVIQAVGFAGMLKKAVQWAGAKLELKEEEVCIEA